MSHLTLKGSRNKFVNTIAKWVFEWQLQHNCIVEIIYVNTKENLSDAPSRALDHADEIKITSDFQLQIERDFKLVIHYNYKSFINLFFF